ncbi:four helix bundle protein [Patescibacteria group bacterium]|nr:four helix bundle protein [Patescibacteria group bacterium]
MTDNRKYKKELLQRLLKFAVRIIILSNKLPKTPAGFAIANQIVRSGTSIGANCEEAQDAFSRRDFLKSINISLKEARETRYWLMAIKASKMLPDSLVDFELGECEEIVAILTSSVKTTKKDL